MISVHELIQPTQERTKKSNPEWGIASAMELRPDKDLIFGKSQKTNNFVLVTEQ